MRIAISVAFAAALAALAAAVSPPRPTGSAESATGRFDLDVRKSGVLRLGKSHLETVSAFTTHTDEFFGGRTKALMVQMFTVPIDSAARSRLLKNEHDDRDVSRAGSATFVLFLDAQNRIAQVNLTYVIPGSTVVRTVAWQEADLAKSFADYQYTGARLRLRSKGTYVTGADSPDETLTLSWDVDVDTPVVEHLARRE